MITKRHTVSVLRPSELLDTRGQVESGTDLLLAAMVPCSIEPLAGRELELARMQWPTVTHRVRLYVDPSWKLVPRDYLRREGTADRIDLEIADVRYLEEIEREAILVCTEWRRSHPEAL